MGYTLSPSSTAAVPRTFPASVFVFFVRFVRKYPPRIKVSKKSGIPFFRKYFYTLIWYVK